MSFGLGRGRELDDSGVGVRIGPGGDLPSLPDDATADPRAGHVDIRAWFPQPDHPLEIEIGSGKGTFLVQQGALRPETNYLGIEYAREFYLYAADRIRRRVEAAGGLTNVRMLNTDAFEFLCWRVPDACARVIHLYFADPWPKTRHHKRRMVRDEFLRQCRRVLEPGGELRIVTDHAEYWAWMEEHFARWCLPLVARHSVPGSEEHRPTTGGFVRMPFDRAESAGQDEVVGTNFERKYKREGRPFYGAILKRI
ncbi:MAG: hypothetical protein KF869_01390 [Phycisphaeraceae bacterium]|nr:hypothetical protein [Phycisphaeraceae bacterium]